MRLPKPFGGYDKLAVATLATAVLAWTLAPVGSVTAVLAAAASILHAWRLARWSGWQALEEPMLAMLHAAYAFVPLGLAAIGAAAAGWLSQPSALHLLTVGGIGGMTLAVMTRASLGHTGRPTAASPLTALAYFALLIAATLRPFAELVPLHYHTLLAASGGAWLAAFGLFLVRYAPILASAPQVKGSQ